jgi:hypothetical protein
LELLGNMNIVSWQLCPSWLQAFCSLPTSVPEKKYYDCLPYIALCKDQNLIYRESKSLAFLVLFNFKGHKPSAQPWNSLILACYDFLRSTVYICTALFDWQSGYSGLCVALVVKLSILTKITLVPCLGTEDRST